jgi:hypothetical protein
MFFFKVPTVFIFLVFGPTTALVKVVNDLRANTDAKQLSVLVLLDLSAAFNTVDHDVLLDRLEKWVGLSGSSF